MEKEFLKISEYAKKMYFHSGKIEGFQDQDTKTIFIKNSFADKEKKDDFEGERAVLYSRVSLSENKKNLDSQMERLRNYAVAKGYKIKNEIKEIGSGLNDNRKKLTWILENRDKYDFIVIEHKDRLTRFGYNYLELFLNSYGKKIEVINEVYNDKEDLIQDFISIITSFCARIYGQRRSRRKIEKIIKELRESKKGL